MKIISWNVNGLNSILQKDFIKTINQLEADFICIQETKISKDMHFNIGNYYQYFNYSQKSGYSGVGILTKEKPNNVLIGMEILNDNNELENIDMESRVVAVEYNEFFIVSVYVPTAQRRERYNYRQQFDYDFIKYIENLNSKKDVIICGDFNICHKKIDVCNFEHHLFLDNFSDDEKANFEELLDLGFVDTYRYMHPQMRQYTFWQHTDNREEKVAGWRLDYILASNFLKKSIRQANILTEIKGSDHCPIELVINI